MKINTFFNIKLKIANSEFFNKNIELALFNIINIQFNIIKIHFPYYIHYLSLS